jgi:uroporphyrin-III C-methyltransferase/precorrin-2 dehydrogenase/sirohydrochlorin ferrochelatase
LDYLPIFFDIRSRPCLVVGGGAVAARKAELLLRATAAVTVVAPELGRELALHRDAGRLSHRARAFEPGDLDGVTLVIAATDDEAVNREVSTLCRERAIPVNVVDAPELCSFIVPSIVDRSPVIVAVSSGGRSPVLSRILRTRLETMLPASYGRLAALAADLRERVRRRFPNLAQRRRFWEQVLQGPAAEMMLNGRQRAARLAVEVALQQHSPGSLSSGEVYLVGAGPGDPDLLTFRALRLMQQADVVVYDRLVAPAILDCAHRGAERIFVGKARGEHSVPQDEINRLLVRLARDGKRVARLKGGDPFIFGRGGEEADALAEAGIPFQIVPGVTAASGCAAYAGIPLTHRDLAHSCIFVPGHLKDGGDLDWRTLAQPHQTLVVYMGLHTLEPICRRLIAEGLSAATPAALVQEGTTRNQRVLIGNLASLPARAAEVAMRPPSLLIIGEVVRLHERLAWFETASLAADAPLRAAG